MSIGLQVLIFVASLAAVGDFANDDDEDVGGNGEA